MDEEVLIDIKENANNNLNIAYILPSWAYKSNKINNYYSIDIWKEGITIKSFSLSVKSYFIIGRNVNLCDITLSNPTISRTHCVLQYKNNEELFIYDLNSVYGTFINGEKILPMKYYKVKSGDIFKVGNSKKLFILNRDSDVIENEDDDNLIFHVNDEIRNLLKEKKNKDTIIFNNESNWGIDDYDKEIQDYQKKEDDCNEIEKNDFLEIKNRKNLNENQKNIIKKIENLKEQMERLIKQRKNIKYQKEENPYNKSEQNKLENKNINLLKKIMEIKERIIKLENSLKETIKISEEKQIKFDKKKYNYYNENEEFFDETKNIENNSNIEIDNYDTVKLRIEKLLKEKQKLLDKKLEIEKNKKSNIQKDSLDEFFENLNNNNEISIEEQIENLNKKIQQEESLLKFVSPINLKIGTNEKRENFKEEEKNIISKENLNKHSIAKFIDSFQKQQEINIQKAIEEKKLFQQKELEDLQKPLNSNVPIDEDMKIKLEQYERFLNGENKVKKNENKVKENGEKSLFKEIIKNIGNDNFDINNYSKFESKKKEKKNIINEMNLPTEEEYLGDLIQKKRKRDDSQEKNYNMSYNAYNEMLYENEDNLEDLKHKYKEESVSQNPFNKYLKND